MAGRNRSRSSRCSSANRCRCFHVFSDGTAVPGDGSSGNPYLHTQPRIDCVYSGEVDEDGQPIDLAESADSSGCITQPGAICIKNADGSEIPRGTSSNSNGCFRISEAGLVRWFMAGDNTDDDDSGGSNDDGGGSNDDDDDDGSNGDDGNDPIVEVNNAEIVKVILDGRLNDFVVSGNASTPETISGYDNSNSDVYVSSDNYGQDSPFDFLIFPQLNVESINGPSLQEGYEFREGQTFQALGSMTWTRESHIPTMASIDVSWDVELAGFDILSTLNPALGDGAILRPSLLIARSGFDFDFVDGDDIRWAPQAMNAPVTFNHVFGLDLEDGEYQVLFGFFTEQVVRSSPSDRWSVNIVNFRMGGITH